jgi:OOP family OmpA-OmpF porin
MKALKILFVVIFCFGFMNVEAQINIGEKLKRQTNNRANKNVDQGINKSLDNVENGVKDLFKKKKPTDGQVEDQVKENNTAEPQEVKHAADSSLSLAAYSKYDFIPGEKVIFYEDFSQDAVGDFPALWNTNGSAEVVTTNLFPGNWLKFITRDAIWTDELLKLPDNYTVEFDVIPIKGTEGGMGGYGFRLMQTINEKSYDTGAIPGKAAFAFYVEYFGRAGYRTYINSKEGEGLGLSSSNEDKDTYEKENQKYHIAIWIQKARVRLYQNETKLFDLPKAFNAPNVKFDRLRFEDGAAMVSNIRVAIGAPDTRNKLMTEGKLVTYGIYFDVNKDVVKPESYGTLKDIATVLNEVPDVKVKIVGHTDSDGADAANLDLSKRRAASVKAELVKSFNVNGDRLITDGAGETQAVAPNDTPVNKALNRRVEFIKL